MVMNIEEIVAFESIKNVIEAYDDSMQDYLYVVLFQHWALMLMSIDLQIISQKWKMKNNKIKN